MWKLLPENRMHFIRLCSGCCALIVLIFINLASAQTYQLTDLGTLGLAYSVATGINANGQVVGYSWTPGGVANHAFLYDGTMHDLGTLGGMNSYANEINDRGKITGSSERSDGNIHAFLYDGTMHDLGTLGSGYSVGIGINNVNQVVGESYTAGGFLHAFLYSGNAMHDLGTFDSTPTYISYGLGINAAGQVVGTSSFGGTGLYHAFLYSSNIMHDLGTLGGNNSWGYAINASGQVTGASDVLGNAETHAFLYDGTMHDLGTLGGAYTQGNGINAVGQVVGYSGGAAFVYDASHGMVDLNTLVDPLSGWALTNAAAINDAGQIVGTGINSNSDTHAILLTPVPEPSTLGLLTLGGVITFAAKRRSFQLS
jgi:probable HAF family extracellular repeat protein